LITSPPAKSFSSQFKLVVIVGSAGALNPLAEILGSLPLDFGAAVVVVQHRKPEHSERLAQMLHRLRRWM
jgi:two-component system chemotaxis response regulator CheB